MLRAIELIEQYGQYLGMPHVKKVTSVLYELRIRGKQEVRIFFIIKAGSALLLHGFVKKSQKRLNVRSKQLGSEFVVDIIITYM